MPVVSLDIKYICSLFHGDEVVIESEVLTRQRARWPWVSRFLKDGNIIAEARVELVLLERVGEEYILIRNPPEKILSYLSKLHLGPSLE